MTAVMFVLVCAALLKAASLGEFRDALEESWGLSSPLSEPVAMLLPVVEMATAASWILGVARRTAWVGAIILLIGFTSAFAWIWIIRAPPDCMCFGKIKMFEDAQHAAMWVVIRNAGLLCLLLAGAWLSRARSTPQQASPFEEDSNAPRLHAH